jgi:hypothetical protein
MHLLRVLIAGLSLFFLASCSTPLKPTGFLGQDDVKMMKNKELPFSRSWKNPDAKMSRYSAIAVKPMQVNSLRRLGFLGRQNVRNIGTTYKKDANALAELGAQKFSQELGATPNRKVSITRNPGKRKGLMILETNLAQMEPGRPSMQVFNFLIPFVSVLNRPSLGLEGRFVDAATGKTLFAFSDLERPEVSLLDVQKFTYYGVHYRELGRWAKQLRQVVDGDAKTLVRDPFVFQPVNW